MAEQEMEEVPLEAILEANITADLRHYREVFGKEKTVQLIQRFTNEFFATVD